MASLEEALIELKTHINGKVKFGEVVALMKWRGFPIFLILFSLPFCLPVQIPGTSTPFGIALAFMGLRVAFGKKMWWPKSWLEKDVPHETLNKIIDVALKYNAKVHRYIYPRLTVLIENPIIHRVHGILAFMLACLLAMPIPIPFTNLMSAFPLLILGLGLLEDDGLLIIIAYLWAFLTFGFFIGLIIAGKHLF